MTAAIIQARISSTRLPGKVLLEIEGRPMLSYMLGRVRKAESIDRIVVATSIENTDDPIADFCEKEKIFCYRGSLNDVLDRYYQAASGLSCNTIVRLTADCPLIDPRIIDQAVKFYRENRGSYDFVANTVPPPSTYPDGMDVEVFDFALLARAYLEAKLPSEREHVTFYMWKTKKFRIYQLKHVPDYSKYRLTVDYPQDFEVIKIILENLYLRNPLFSMEDIVEFIVEQDDILRIQQGIERNIGWEKSLEKDRALKDQIQGSGI